MATATKTKKAKKTKKVVTKTKIEYQGKNGLENDAAQLLGKELEQIQKKHGGREPEFVERWASTHMKSAWAQRLCWDDEHTGVLYRRHQIGVMQRNIVIVQYRDGKTHTRRAFVMIPVKDRKKMQGRTEKLVPVSVLKTDKEKGRDAARRQFKRWRSLLPELVDYVEDGWKSDSEQVKAFRSLQVVVAELGQTIGVL